jgi:phosphopantothenoylcysteine decarboxylase/phosphopantothenate--cysteine ligase
MRGLIDKRIVLGVTGSIAAYKAVELLRYLTKAGAKVTVAMTANATWFVGPLTFETLSGSPVIYDMFSQPGTSLDHVTLGHDSDLIIIAPATANFLAKMAHGLGDDFLSALLLAATSPILVCPAMDKEMFVNTIVQSNLLRLKEQGCIVMDPDEGVLASGAVGIGRFPDPAQIVQKAAYVLSNHDLKALRILVTAGPTIEYLDPVRIVTNRSTGKMGYALAKAAWRRGAEVTLISGPTHLDPPLGVKVVKIQTAEEMREAVLHAYDRQDAVIKAAAVSDYKPLKKAKEKEKKKMSPTTVEMGPTPDILAELGRQKGDVVLVGFAAETTNHRANALKKLRKKNLDMIVVNDVSRQDRGFAADSNEVRIIDKQGNEEVVPLMSKEDVADRILDRIKESKSK